jgi:hypothetical protein
MPHLETAQQHRQISAIKVESKQAGSKTNPLRFASRIDFTSMPPVTGLSPVITRVCGVSEVSESGRLIQNRLKRYPFGEP